MSFKSLLALPLLLAALQAASEDDLTFTPNGNTEYSVSSCDPSASGILDIPNTYNGKPVTSIGQYAFQGCSSLTSISIPNSVASIGDYAFGDCTALTSITIPDSVTSILSYAFASCTSLTSLTIPDSVTSIEEQAFYLPSVYSTTYAGFGLTSITLSNNLTSIGAEAFKNQRFFTSITIPATLTNLSSLAFGRLSINQSE